MSVDDWKRLGGSKAGRAGLKRPAVSMACGSAEQYDSLMEQAYAALVQCVTCELAIGANTARALPTYHVICHDPDQDTLKIDVAVVFSRMR